MSHTSSTNLSALHRQFVGVKHTLHTLECSTTTGVKSQSRSNAEATATELRRTLAGTHYRPAEDRGLSRPGKLFASNSRGSSFAWEWFLSPHTRKRLELLNQFRGIGRDTLSSGGSGGTRGREGREVGALAPERSRRGVRNSLPKKFVTRDVTKVVRWCLLNGRTAGYRNKLSVF